jgi:lambda family phage minor tail protein L
MTIDSTSIAEDIQYLAPGSIIDLYELDATNLGASQKYYFTNNTDNGELVVFGGITYYPLDFEIEGLEISGAGQLPEPIIRLSNVNNSIGAAVIGLSDLVGASVTRRRTLTKYLDGETTADPTAQFPLESFVIDQKTAHNKRFIEFKLVSFFDYQGIKIPKRQVLRDYCNFIYRYYDTNISDFDYSKVLGCPYVSETPGSFWDRDGIACAASADNCGKRLSDCVLRFPGNDTPIPFGGFPGVAKIRVR